MNEALLKKRADLLDWRIPTAALHHHPTPPMKKPSAKSAPVRKPALQAAKKAARKAAKKTVAKKVARKAAKRAGRKVSATPAAQGPITLAQARALAGGPPPERAMATKAAVARMVAFRAAAPAPATPESVAMEHERLEAQRNREDEERIQHYKATMALLQERGVRGMATRGADAAAAAAPGPLRIFAEGDSWFDYPFPLFGGGIIKRLEDRLGLPILNLAKAGDEVRFMLGVEQRLKIITHLKNGSPAGGAWDVMLFSGGGNDIVDNPMVLWLNRYKPGMSAAQLINQPRYTHALALVRAAYEDLIALRDALSPGTRMIFHAYDYAIPDGRGACHLGPWLKPSLDVKGVPANSTLAKGVVKEMLRQFALMLDGLASEHSDITFINGQGTLPQTTGSWHNELHPERAGFNKFADLFRAKLKALYPGRVP